MVKIYVKRIKEGTMTVEEVPVRWREGVDLILKAEGYDNLIADLTV